MMKNRLFRFCAALFFFFSGAHFIGTAEPAALWTGPEPVPARARIESPRNVEYVRVKERAPEKDGLVWQHGAAIVRYKGDFYVSVGVNTGSENSIGEKILMMKSPGDWRHWETPVLLEPNDAERGRSHGVFLEKDGKLLSFHAKFVAKGKGVGDNFPGLTMEAFQLDEQSGIWENLGDVARGVWPLQTPIPLSNGVWIVAGCDENWRGAVALSRPNDLLRWETVKVGAPGTVFTEGNLWREGDDLVLLLRNESPRRAGTVFGVTARSRDGGRTWSEPSESNLPMNRSKPACGVLSDGSRYLVGLTASDNDSRAALTIAVGAPGENGLSRVWKIRDIADPVPPNAFEAASFAYPCAVQYDDLLFVIYSVGAPGERGNHNHIELAVLSVSELTAASR